MSTGRSWRIAQGTCGALRPARRAQAACAEALLGEAEVLEHAGRTEPTIRTYLAIPARADDDAATAATAVYRAGEILLQGHQVTPAWTALWRVVTDYPNEPIAADALRAVVTDGRRRDARALADELGKLLTPLAETQIGDNLLWSLADLTEHELSNAEAARAIYDRIPVDYPASGLRDDARWHAARISRLLHDPAGAAQRLRALLATREVAIVAGSYFSIWLDDAQLELGKTPRDELHDLPGAAAAFRRLPSDYPASILRDDALYELAVTLEQMHDHAGACVAVARLGRQFADSKYLARTQELGCYAHPSRSCADWSASSRPLGVTSYATRGCSVRPARHARSSAPWYRPPATDPDGAANPRCPTAKQLAGSRARRLLWADLLRRVFTHDVLA